MATVDVQPWIKFFDMLRTYEQYGLMEVQADKHEAYVTFTALLAMTDGEDPQQQIASGALTDTTMRIQTYAAWKSQQGKAYLRKLFAVHVVQDDEPHDLIFTLLMRRRQLNKKPRMEVIDYRQHS